MSSGSRTGWPRAIEGCELCSQDGGEAIYRDDLLRVVLVDDADYPGFCRVICNAHVKEMSDLEAMQREKIMRTVFAVEATLREILQPDKINLASLGNVTPHLHWHVIPRFHGDAHFPNPIWGERKRSATPALPRDWLENLRRSLQTALSQG